MDLVIARGKAIDRITFARTIRSSATLAAPYERAQVAAYIAECVDHLTRDGHRDVALFDLLRDALVAVEQHPSSLIPHPSSLITSLTTPFTLRLLCLLGYAPQLDRCIECRIALPAGPAIGVPLRGGLVCQSCAPSSRSGTPITDGDREHLAVATAAFRPFSPSMTLMAFAQGLLEAHLWQPLRTAPTFPTLTRDPAAATMVQS